MFLAAHVGFEPTNAGIKTRCLRPTWRMGNNIYHIKAHSHLLLEPRVLQPLFPRPGGCVPIYTSAFIWCSIVYNRMVFSGFQLKVECFGLLNPSFDLTSSLGIEPGVSDGSRHRISTLKGLCPSFRRQRQNFRLLDHDILETNPAVSITFARAT